jgi:hypothetical protein
MMMKVNWTACSVFCLAISIAAGSWFIGTAVKESNKEEQIEPEAEHSMLMNPDEAAAYLGISIEEFRKLGPFDQESHDDSSIPFIKIGTRIYFTKPALDMWLSAGGFKIFQ